MPIKDMLDGLIATIEAHGKWTVNEISACDYGIANLSGSTVHLSPGPDSSIFPLTGGLSACGGSRQKQATWNIAGMVLVKDPGSPTLFLGRLWTAYDDIFDSVNSDDTLDGKVEAAHISAISRPSPDAFIEGEGADYGFINFVVTGVEYTAGS